MKILNYTNFVQFGLKSSDDKKSSKTKIQTLDYKTNPNILSLNLLESDVEYKSFMCLIIEADIIDLGLMYIILATPLSMAHFLLMHMKASFPKSSR